MNVNHRSTSGGIIGIPFSIFFNMRICCVFLLELPHRGDSNGYTQYTIFDMKIENHPKSAAMGFFPETQEGVRYGK